MNEQTSNNDITFFIILHTHSLLIVTTNILNTTHIAVAVTRYRWFRIAITACRR
jgi:hypothetical protein